MLYMCNFQTGKQGQTFLQQLRSALPSYKYKPAITAQSAVTESSFHPQFEGGSYKVTPVREAQVPLQTTINHDQVPTWAQTVSLGSADELTDLKSPLLWAEDFAEQAEGQRLNSSSDEDLCTFLNSGSATVPTDFGFSRSSSTTLHPATNCKLAHVNRQLMIQPPAHAAVPGLVSSQTLRNVSTADSSVQHGLNVVASTSPEAVSTNAASKLRVNSNAPGAVRYPAVLRGGGEVV